MDTTEQVLPLPSHSEVLPSLPCVSALPACPYTYVPCSYVYTHAHLIITSHLPSLSEPLSKEGGGAKKSSLLVSLLVSYFFLRLLIMPLICSPTLSHFAHFDLVLLVPFLYLPHPLLFLS